MHVRRTASLLALLLFAAVPAQAQAKPATSYLLRHPSREHCRAHFRKLSVAALHRADGAVTTVRDVLCVRGAEKLALRGRLDPTFTQSPENPRAVTYSYSATAVEQYGGVQFEPASLPRGVLTLYNEGRLACSIDVGGPVSGGSCPITYGVLGPHTVTVTYYSGEASGTQTETEQIKPFSTRTTMKVQGPMACSAGPPSQTESCSYIATVATVDQNGNPPSEGGDNVLVNLVPREEFVPGFGPSDLGMPGPGFDGPVTFTLRREHNTEGSRCSIRAGRKIDYFYVLDAFDPNECGTSMTVVASFYDFIGYGEPEPWEHSISEPVAVQF